MSDFGAITPDWIAVDWGTSHVRVAAIAPDGSILARRESSKGMSVLERDEFEPALLALISQWLTAGHRMKVVCCGMVGSRQGWVEAPYRTTPCSPISEAIATRAKTTDDRIDVAVVAGLRQIKPADIMRGEETQIAGCLAEQPDFVGVICLPGTHTKWVRISAGEIVGFATFLTGELFALLAGRSVLRHSVAAQGWDDQSFLDAMGCAFAKPEMVAARLFSLRAEHLTADLSPEIARARLSGLLIGLELAAARQYWLGENVALVGANGLARSYGAALKTLGITPKFFDAESITVAGLSIAHSRLDKSRVHV